MRTIKCLLVLFVAIVGGLRAESGSVADREGFEKTRSGLAAAFARGDVAAIAKYHHPDVQKALSYSKYLIGREAVLADLRQTFAAYTMTFVEDNVESVTFFGDTCVEQSKFAVRGEPKGNAKPFLFKGRSMVVYVRSKDSPSGWASIREVVQPADR